MSESPIYLTFWLLAVFVNQQGVASGFSEGSPAYNWVESVESQDWVPIRRPSVLCNQSRDFLEQADQLHRG